MPDTKLQPTSKDSAMRTPQFTIFIIEYHYASEKTPKTLKFGFKKKN